MPTFDTVREIARGIARAEEGTTPASKLGGKLFVRLWEDGETMVALSTIEERDELIASDPSVYFLTDHYLKYPYVLVRLKKIDRETLGDLVRSAAKKAAASRKR